MSRAVARFSPLSIFINFIFSDEDNSGCPLLDLLGCHRQFVQHQVLWTVAAQLWARYSSDQWREWVIGKLSKNQVDSFSKAIAHPRSPSNELYQASLRRASPRTSPDFRHSPPYDRPLRQPSQHVHGLPRHEEQQLGIERHVSFHGIWGIDSNDRNTISEGVIA